MLCNKLEPKTRNREPFQVKLLEESVDINSKDGSTPKIPRRVIIMVVKVPLKKLRPGMKLAKPLYRGYIMLLAADSYLTDEHIRQMNRWQVDQLAIYI